MSRTLAGAGLSAALALSSLSPASALPLATGAAPGAPSTIESVRCDGCWIAGGVAAGVLAGAAIAGASPRPYYDEYAPPVYYAPAPRVYYAPPPPPRRYTNRCWIQTGRYEGQGYWGRC